MSESLRKDASTSVPTGIELIALDPTFRADPYPVLARLRELEPVHYDEEIKRWVVTRAEDADRVIHDRTMAVDARKANPNTYMRIFLADRGRGRDPSMLLLDPPDHTRLRGLVSKAFTPRRIELLAPRIRAIVTELLDAVEGEASFDLIARFASPLPITVIAEMLGVDPADRDDFKRWSDATAQMFNPLLTEEERTQVMASNEELDTYLRQAIAGRRSDPREDLISAMVAVEEAGDQLKDEEIVTMCGLLLAAGNLTTTDLIGNGVWLLLSHPDELRKLRANPALIKNAVEEMLRFESPVVQTGRIATTDLKIGECPVKRGESVLASLAAANRDPAAYPEPDRFDITRENVQHHSFGGGVHYCLGAPLARLEAQLAIGALVERFPNLRLVDEPLEWRAVPSFRALAKLRVMV